MTDPSTAANDLAAIERELTKLDAARSRTDPQLLPILDPFHATQESELRDVHDCWAADTKACPLIDRR